MGMHTTAIGEHTYTFVDMPALTGARLLVKLKGFLAPLVGGDGLDADISKVLDALDESVIDTVMIPMFAACDLTRVTEGVPAGNRKLGSEAQINVCFPTVADLANLIELARQVAMVQFGDFFASLLALFGNQGGGQQAGIPISRKLAR